MDGQEPVVIGDEHQYLEFLQANSVEEKGMPTSWYSVLWFTGPAVCRPLPQTRLDHPIRTGNCRRMLGTELGPVVRHEILCGPAPVKKLSQVQYWFRKACILFRNISSRRIYSTVK